jgi:hypothetical protein
MGADNFANLPEFPRVVLYPDRRRPQAKGAISGISGDDGEI